MNWDKLLEEHGKALLLYARQWANCHADAEEILQDGMIRFWKAWKKRADKITAPIPYLYTTIKRTALDRIRSTKRRQQREEHSADIIYNNTPPFMDNYENQEQQTIIKKTIQKLPIEQREVLIMKIWGNLTFKNIAQSLNIPLNTVASRYRYALTTLRTELNKVGVEL